MSPPTDGGRPCIFCAIVDGALSAAVVHRDDVAVAFLDRSPVFKGHVLVVPTAHVETLTDLPGGALEIGEFFTRVRLLAATVQDTLDAHGTWVSINNTVSQSVPHLHVHIVPRRRKDGLKGFYWPRQKYADDTEMAEFAARISAGTAGAAGAAAAAAAAAALTTDHRPPAPTTEIQR